MQKSKFLFALGATLLSTQLGHADGFYADGGYAFVPTDDSVFPNESSAPEFSALGGHVGYNFSQFFSLEGEALVGIGEEETTITNTMGTMTETLEVETRLNYLVGAYAKANLPVAPNLEAFAKIGIAGAEVEGSVDEYLIPADGAPTLTDSSKGSGAQAGLAFGAGATYDLTETLYLRGDYTRYEFEDGEMNGFMLGAGVRF
jgi:opacity protein-like surface antigen